MANRLIERWLKPRFVLSALLLALVITVILSPVVEVSSGPYLSTRSRAIDGARGLREVLDRLGWRTSERIVPFAGNLDTTSTYFILHTPIDPTSAEVHALLEAVRHGARAIVVPKPGTALADSIGVQVTTKVLATLYAVSDSLFGSYDRVDTLREAFGIFDARSFHGYLEGTPASDSDSAGALASTGANASLHSHIDPAGGAPGDRDSSIRSRRCRGDRRSHLSPQRCVPQDGWRRADRARA